ncbi:MAG: hypothetical protein ACOC5M_01105 [Chloroflexota bacterium]
MEVEVIPEAYWRIIGRWWWLIGMLFVLGSAGGYLASTMWVTYESQAAIEVKYVQQAGGEVSFDEYDRRVEANRIAAELGKPWVSRKVKDELASSEAPNARQAEDSEISVEAPSRSESQVGPAVITLKSRNERSVAARVAAEAATEAYTEYIVQRHNEFLAEHLEKTGTQEDRTRAQLEEVLQTKRDALLEEADRIETATEALISSGNSIAARLPVMLDDFRRQVGAAGDSSSSTEELDQAIGELRAEIVSLQEDWQSNLDEPLGVLYSAEAQPEYQLAVAREEPMRSRYEKALVSLMALRDSEDLGAPVQVLERGTSAELVPVLGIQTRYTMIGGGLAGLILGWVLANLGDFILQTRARRRPNQDAADGDDSEPESGEAASSVNGSSPEPVEARS